MTRIAVGGFSCTRQYFAPTESGFDAFVQGRRMAADVQGAKLLEKMRNVNVGMAGFVPRRKRKAGSWCRPSGAPQAHRHT